MSEKPPVEEVEHLERAPTLYFIIGTKLLKGLLFTFLAFAAYQLSDNDLPQEYQRLLAWVGHYRLIHVNPESKFWVDIATKVDRLTESRMIQVSLGTFLYSLFAWVEGIGLIYRVSWAGWLAIGESAFFIPIEILELTHHYSTLLGSILVLNVAMVWYLYQNRARLFHHHSPHLPAKTG